MENIKKALHFMEVQFGKDIKIISCEQIENDIKVIWQDTYDNDLLYSIVGTGKYGYLTEKKGGWC